MPIGPGDLLSPCKQFTVRPAIQGTRMRSLKLGPGVLVAAAFIGPGTVTTCVLAGQNFGASLLWVLVLATLSTIVLQEMVARLGAGARQGLGEALVTSLLNPVLRWSAVGLMSAAILIGNAAYQGGNLAGAALGANALLGTDIQRPAVLMIALAAGAVLEVELPFVPHARANSGRQSISCWSFMTNLQ